MAYDPSQSAREELAKYNEDEMAGKHAAGDALRQKYSGGPGGPKKADFAGNGDVFANPDEYKYNGGRTQWGANRDAATYGGSAAKYDKYGNLIQESSANQEADYYRNQAEAAQGRRAYQMDTGQSDEDRAEFYRQMSAGTQDRAYQFGAMARQAANYRQQGDAAEMYRQMSMGNGPSLAAAMLQNQNATIAAQQASAAASARGPAAMALAQQNAAANTAAAQQGAAGQMAQIRAQEQLGAMGGYQQGLQGMANTAGNIANTATNMRGQDYAAAGLQNQSRSVSQQGEIAQGQLEANQRALNDAQQRAMEANRMGVYGQQQQGQLQQRALETGQGQLALNKEALHSAQTNAMVGQVMGGVGLGAGLMLGGPGGAAAGYAAGQASGGVVSSAGGSSDPDSSGIIRQNPYSDMRLKTNISSLAAAEMSDRANSLERSQAAMYGAPQAAGGEMSRRADGLAAAMRSAYDAPSPVQHALQNLKPYAYNYRDGIGEDPSQRHVGIMAQDLERTPAGATIVKDGPRGKQIDAKGAISLNLAAAADLQKQVDDVKRQNASLAAALMENR